MKKDLLRFQIPDPSSLESRFHARGFPFPKLDLRWITDPLHRTINSQNISYTMNLDKDQSTGAFEGDKNFQSKYWDKNSNKPNTNIVLTFEAYVSKHIFKSFKPLFRRRSWVFRRIVWK